MIITDFPIWVLLGGLMFLSVGLLIKIFPGSVEQLPPPFVINTFIIGGKIAILLSHRTTIDINKLTSEAKISKFSIFGISNKSYPIQSITSIVDRRFIKARTTSSNTGSTMRTQRSQLNFQLSDTSLVPLTIFRTTGNEESQRKIGNKISQFLNVPFTQSDTDVRFFGI